MKKLQLVSWIVFILGVTFKLLHYPGASPLLSLGCLLLLTHSIIFLFKNVKTNLTYSLLNLTFLFWTIYLLFRFQYWKFAQLIFAIALLVSITYFVLHLVHKTQFKMPQIVLTIYVVFCLSISYVHAYRIYYFFSLNSILNNESRNYDYHAWDKYSWFLYIAGKKEEAIEANQNAQNTLDQYLKIIQDNEAIQYSDLIEQHHQQILNESWVSYP